MTAQPQEPDALLDRMLRDVALPSGFVARLEAITSEPDSGEMTPEEIAELDAGLLGLATVEFNAEVETEELASVLALSSDEVSDCDEFEVADVAEVEDVGFDAQADDRPLNNGQIDRWLRRVRLPAGLVARLRGLVGDSEHVGRRGRSAHLRTGQLSAAAVLLIAFGVCYFGAAATYLLAYHVPRRAGDPSFELQGSGLDGSPAIPEGSLEEPIVDFDSRLVLSPSMPTDQELVNEALLGSMTGPEFFSPRPESEAGLTPAISGIDPGASLSGKTILGFPPGTESMEEDERFPEPEVVPWEVVRGIAPPRASGFDLPFLIRNGTHPMVPVDPMFRADPGLRFCQVPLRSETFSYDLCRRMLMLDRPEFPNPRDIRVEDFLAAIDYGWDRPQEKDGGLRLHVHGAPSLFKNSGNARVAGKQLPLPVLPALIQVGVQARDEVDGWRQACRLTVLVDRSRSMRRGGRIDMVRQALGELTGRMGPADRLSLVAYDREASVLLEDAAMVDPAAKADAAAAIEALTAGGSTNLAGGFRAAYAVASGHPRGDRLEHRVVLITDGAELGDAMLTELESRLAAAANRGITLSVIDLGDGSWVGASLLRLAEAGRGRAVRASSAEQIRWALRESLSGRSQLVATKVQLRVEFNPDAIESYRLIGHEVSDLARLEGAPLEVDLRAGQSATALFEVRPRRTDGPMATVELRWRDSFGAEHKRIQPLVGAEFSPRFEDAPVALQRATIAAEAAELLRDSPFVERGMTLSKLIDLAGKVRRDSTGEASYQEFVSLLKRAAAAESARTNRRR